MPDISGLQNLNPHTLISVESQILAAKIIGIAALLGFIMWGADQLFAPISVMRFGIVGFFGKRGSGKSFAAVTYARRWRTFNKNKPVWTNLEKLDLPGYRGPCSCELQTRTITAQDGKKESVLVPTKRCKAVHVLGGLGIQSEAQFAHIMTGRDGLVLIDEAGVFIGSLNFADRGNRKFARWLVATRHYKIMLLLTAHTPGTVNNRLRDVIDEFIQMEAFTTLKMFRGKVYESAQTFLKPKQHTHSVIIPMWWTTCKSYNTDSLLKQAEAAGVSVIGEDFDLPGLGEAINARANGALLLPSSDAPGNNPSTSGDNLPSEPVSVRASTNPSYSGIGTAIDGVAVDVAILGTLIARTSETWNGRKPKPKPKRRIAAQ